MASTQTVFLGLGSNLGNRGELLQKALHLLSKLPLSEMQASAIYESLPYQGMAQPSYFNQVLRGQTTLSPVELLAKCLEIEQRLGRIRQQRWEPRLIDIDILYYGDLILDTDPLRIPHPDLANRSFVLLPLKEIAPEWRDPRTGQTVRTLFQQWQQTHQEPLPTLVESASTTPRVLAT